MEAKCPVTSRRGTPGRSSRHLPSDHQTAVEVPSGVRRLGNRLKLVQDVFGRRRRRRAGCFALAAGDGRPPPSEMREVQCIETYRGMVAVAYTLIVSIHQQP